MLILIGGLPGAGKTTLAKMLVHYYHSQNKDVVMLAADDYMIDDAGKYKFDPTKLEECHAQCIADAFLCLEEGNIVIVHNTFSQNWEKKPYLEKAEQLNIPVQEILIKGPWESVHGCSPITIERMKNRWEYV